jgi:hypothetical protein
VVRDGSRPRDPAHQRFVDYGSQAGPGRVVCRLELVQLNPRTGAEGVNAGPGTSACRVRRDSGSSARRGSRWVSTPVIRPISDLWIIDRRRDRGELSVRGSWFDWIREQEPNASTRIWDNRLADTVLRHDSGSPALAWLRDALDPVIRPIQRFGNYGSQEIERRRDEGVPRGPGGPPHASVERARWRLTHFLYIR